LAARRNIFTAALSTHAAISALRTIIDTYSASESHDNLQPSLASYTARRLRAESARRACATLIQFRKGQPKPNPAPRDGLPARPSQSRLPPTAPPTPARDERRAPRGIHLGPVP